jgi:hypothetical protein
MNFTHYPHPSYPSTIPDNSTLLSTTELYLYTHSDLITLWPPHLILLPAPFLLITYQFLCKQQLCPQYPLFIDNITKGFYILCEQLV